MLNDVKISEFVEAGGTYTINAYVYYATTTQKQRFTFQIKVANSDKTELRKSIETAQSKLNQLKNLF
ncbi:hypothetical protein [Streptococcus equi]|uniref:hypothetical protein n=1 Tax=Streptococcus equi TaxID=1336 RepID=UPI001E52FC13|nr:hypothetical protein [Streptococcus equi]